MNRKGKTREEKKYHTKVKKEREEISGKVERMEGKKEEGQIKEKKKDGRK